MYKRYQFIIILLVLPLLCAAAESCGDSTVVHKAWITEIPEGDFNPGSISINKNSNRRSRSLMIEEDETHPCDDEDAFFLKPGRLYEIEFTPADWESSNPAHYKWTLKIDFDNTMDFHPVEIFDVEGVGVQKIVVQMPTWLRLKRTWLEFEIKKSNTSCASNHCGMDGNGNCIYFRRGIAIDAGATCLPDIACVPFDNITQYESIDSIQANNTTIELCTENLQDGYCSNFLEVLPMYGIGGTDELTVYVGYDGFEFEETVTVWFDTNYDGSYAGEAVAGMGKGKGQITFTVNKPNFHGTFVFMTMRVKLENGSTSTGPCEVVEGEVRDYIVSYNLSD